MTPSSRSYTATDYGGPEVRVRRAIEKALGPELQIDSREDAAKALIAAGLGDRVARYYRELDRFFDSMAGAVVAQCKPLSNEVGAIMRRPRSTRPTSSPTRRASAALSRG